MPLAGRLVSQVSHVQALSVNRNLFCHASVATIRTEFEIANFGGFGAVAQTKGRSWRKAPRRILETFSELQFALKLRFDLRGDPRRHGAGLVNGLGANRLINAPGAAISHSRHIFPVLGANGTLAAKSVEG